MNQKGMLGRLALREAGPMMVARRRADSLGAINFRNSPRYIVLT
jgi:hypothetical protein